MLITAGRLFSGGLARPRVRQHPVPLARRPPDHLHLVGKLDSYFLSISRLFHLFHFFSSDRRWLGPDGRPTIFIWSEGQIRVLRRILGFSSFHFFFTFSQVWTRRPVTLLVHLCFFAFCPLFGLPIGFPIFTHSGYWFLTTSFPGGFCRASHAPSWVFWELPLLPKF